MLQRITQVATVLATLVVPATARACACCTDEGQRLESTGAMRDYERHVWETITFAAAARMYASPGFPDDVEGVAAPSTQPYRVRISRANGRLSLDMLDANGKAGRITLPMAGRFVCFEVDTRDEASKDRGLGPTLYKEWRVEGDATLGGIFAAGSKRAAARLILHGSGNSCTDASSFSHWTLAVRGRGVRFTLLGALGK